MTKRKNKFRAGQRVQLASDPAHVLVIDSSLVPERIYGEKGSNRWYTKSELQRLGAPENPATSLRLNGKGNACGMRANACGMRATAPAPESGVPKRTRTAMQRCLECGMSFKPTREWQKFDRPACRFAYSRRVKPIRAVKVLADAPHDTMATVN